jgi:hypothetical protein
MCIMHGNEDGINNKSSASKPGKLDNKVYVVLLLLIEGCRNYKTGGWLGGAVSAVQVKYPSLLDRCLNNVESTYLKEIPLIH